MSFVEVQTITVRREIRHGIYQRCDGTTGRCLDLTRDCGLGCKCGTQVTKATPGPELAEQKCLCFNDRTKQGISEMKGTARPIKEGPDEWIYEVTAKVIQAQGHKENMLTEEQLTENRRVSLIAEENAKKVLQPGDRLRVAKCPGTKRWITFSHWDGPWIVSKTGINDFSPRCVDMRNGEPIDFTKTPNDGVAYAPARR